MGTTNPNIAFICHFFSNRLTNSVIWQKTAWLRFHSAASVYLSFVSRNRAHIIGHTIVKETVISLPSELSALLMAVNPLVSCWWSVATVSALAEQTKQQPLAWRRGILLLASEVPALSFIGGQEGASYSEKTPTWCEGVLQITASEHERAPIQPLENPTATNQMSVRGKEGHYRDSLRVCECVCAHTR